MNLVLCVDHEWTTNFDRGTLILSLSAKCTDSKNRFLKIALIFSLFLKIALIFSLFLPMQNLLVVNVPTFHNLYFPSSSDATHQNRFYQIC